MKRVIVVGAGLFGSVCGRLAEEHGYQVTYIDDGREGAGSPPSAGLIKPSWLQGFGKAGHEGLAVLDRLYGLEDLTFRMNPTGLPVKVHYINPRRVMDRTKQFMVNARVTQVGDGWVRLQGGEELDGRVLVATGVWANQLVNMPVVRRLEGSAFFYKGTVTTPELTVWAPYKQIKVFNAAPDLIWTGDSTGVKPESYSMERQRESRERCERALTHAGAQPTAYLRTLSGLRPVVEGHREGYFAQVYPRTWVATGGGKMGSVLAGYQATQFVKALNDD